MNRLPIAFLSDFGLSDEFVGVVHGVIARIAPEVRVIDVTHGVGRGDVRAGALALLRAVQYLPPGVALAVVDPGVGSDRRPIAARSPWGYFVGPDNGLLAPAIQMVGGAEQVVALENPQFVIPHEGATFAGRDQFAPAAAVLASGQAKLEDLGSPVAPGTLTPMLLPLTEVSDRQAQGEVWWVDHFGNAQTNIAPQELSALGVQPGDRLILRVGGAVHELPWLSSYAEADVGEALVHIDSYGLMAIAVREGRADERFNLAERLAVSFLPSRAEEQREPPDDGSPQDDHQQDQ
ncbi:MAG: SAM-dependent chlorinase/fluorinase [Actinomycetota bacterium]|nr:SAM-dependent chlorinase/fluorinase [Actinomycetota bacterium]